MEPHRALSTSPPLGRDLAMKPAGHHGKETCSRRGVPGIPGETPLPQTQRTEPWQLVVGDLSTLSGTYVVGEAEVDPPRRGRQERRPRRGWSDSGAPLANRRHGPPAQRAERYRRSQSTLGSSRSVEILAT